MTSIERYLQPGAVAERLFERATHVMPGGNTRTTVFHPPYPTYAVRGEGCWIIDADGDRRLDFVNNYASLIHGHADPDVTRAAIDTLERGACFAMPTEHEIGLAEVICSRVASVERVRFANSGTEAVMMAIKAARAFTGRPKIGKFEGCYHGSYDQAEVSTSSPPETWSADEPVPCAVSHGTPQSVLENAVVMRYNDVELMERLITRHAGELAAVLIDLMPLRSGMIRAEPAFVARLRELTERHGILLIVDEVISFRLAYGGAQSLWNVTPDLSTFGKFIGGGFPVGAIGGRADVMNVFDPRSGAPKVQHGGTFNANPVTMAAGLVAMQKLTPAAFDRLDALGERLRGSLTRGLGSAGVCGRVQGRGSLFYVHFHDRPLSDFRSAAEQPNESARREAAWHHLHARGMELMPYVAGALSTPMTEREVDALATAFGEAIGDVSFRASEASRGISMPGR